MDNACSVCGASLDMVGRAHRCIPRSRGDLPVIAAVKTAAPRQKELDASGPREQFDRKAYQRSYMREYMRKYREKDSTC